MDFLGVPQILESDTFFADVGFGVEIDDELQTSLDGRTVQPDIYLAEANSLFDSTMTLNFVAKPTLPGPEAGAALVIVYLGVLGCRPKRRRQAWIESTLIASGSMPRRVSTR